MSLPKSYQAQGDVEMELSRPSGMGGGRRAAVVIASSLGVLVGASGCAADPGDMLDDSTAGREDSVVYGDDDRKDFFQEADAAKQQLTRESIVALMSGRTLRRQADGTHRLAAGTLDSLCPGQPFRGQISAAFCSGTLIDDDLVLTAGHCISTCGDTKFVFNYFQEAEGRLATIRDADVYSCKQVTARSNEFDFSVVQLDRPVTGGHKPAKIRLGNAPLAVNSPVVMIGMGIGLPAKIDSGGRVTVPGGNNPNRFLATVDAFGGNSGSGVFTSDLKLVGVLTAGNADFIDQGNCEVVNRLAADTRNAETVRYSFHGVDAACSSASGVASDALCRDGNSAGGSEFQFCARENQRCEFTGTKTVRYGANGQFVEKTLTNGTPCTNAVFGDPIVGVVKQCFVK